MFSSLAWPRVFYFTLILSCLTRNSYAREESLCEYSPAGFKAPLTDVFPVTSSVSYCNPPETLLIQRFEVAYFPSNTSVSFNVSVSSVVRFHVSHNTPPQLLTSSTGAQRQCLCQHLPQCLRHETFQHHP